MKTIFKLLMVSIVLFTVSCNEDDRILFDPDNQEDTILNLATASSETTANLGIQVLETGVTVDVMLQSSTRLGTDRSFSVSIIEEETTIDAIYYSVPSSITIAANEFVGNLTITGQDPVGELTSGALIIEVTDGGDYTERFTINVSVVAVFAGAYQLTALEGVFPAFGATQFSYPDGPVFITPVGEDQEGVLRQRTIIGLNYLAEFGGFPGDFVFNIVDDTTVVIPRQASGGGVVCGAGSPVLEIESSPDDQATVDVNNDSTYQLIFQDGVGDDACGIDPYRIVLELTRI